MTSQAYATVIRASARDRLDLFLATANWLGAPVGNIEKDFWVCWTLDVKQHAVGTPEFPMLSALSHDDRR